MISARTPLLVSAGVAASAADEAAERHTIVPIADMILALCLFMTLLPRGELSGLEFESGAGVEISARHRIQRSFVVVDVTAQARRRVFIEYVVDAHRYLELLIQD